MNTLVTFATQWGSKYGGINSFNVDFLSAFAFAYPQSTQVICIVPSFDPTAAEESAKANVRLVSLPYTTNTATLDSKHGTEGVEQLRTVASLWKNLTVRQKNNAEPYWLCAVAGYAQFDGDFTDVDWRLECRSYVKQRNGQIPAWMFPVAQRLGFQWPEELTGESVKSD